MKTFWFLLASIIALPLFGGSIPGFTTAPVNYAGVVYDATAGPDGNTWFIDQVNDVVGRVAQDGTVTTFPLAKGAAPQSIIAGGDGNLWFSELHNKIGRISTAGFLAEFPTPAAPGRLTRGADGAIWFLETELGGIVSKIGRMATDGTITSFDLGARDVIADLVTGGDANLWLSDFTKNTAVKFSPLLGRVLATVPIPSPGFASDRMVLGRDRNVWFTHGNSIERITPDGVLSEFAAPSGSSPFSMTVGSDGNLWFCEYSSRRIGQLVIPRSGGAPLFNESDQLSDPPGVIVAARIKPATSGKTVAPLGDQCGDPCIAPSFIVGLDKPASSASHNMTAVFTPPPDGCADLLVEMGMSGDAQNGVFQGDKVTITVRNRGPQDATGVIATLTVNAADPIVVHPWPSSPKPPDNVDIGGQSATMTKSDIACGDYMMQTFIIEGIAGGDNAAAIGVAVSAVADPSPSNNVEEAYWDSAANKRVVVNPPLTEIVVTPVQRGK